MTMLTEKFDAYGGVLPEVARDRRETTKASSLVLSRIGQYAFWLLVVVILSARIIYYPVNPASEFPNTRPALHAATR